MDAERIARKLQPLMAEQVQRWLRARDLVDPETRSLIDKRIRATAQHKLGDLSSEILLSLPPRSVARGKINLGTVLYAGERWPVGLRPEEIIAHLGIFGRSGAGKTNLVFHLLRQLGDRNVVWLFLDWKRTARHLLPHLKQRVNIYTPGRSLVPFAFNPFIPPPGMEYDVYLQHIVDMLASAYTLGDGARSVLTNALLACWESGNEHPSIADVLAEIEKLPDKERIRGWKISAIRALESLRLARLTTSDALTQSDLVEGLRHQSTIVELDALSAASKAFLIPVLALWLYQMQLAARQREKLQLVIVIEEAHHVLHGQTRAKETAMEMLLRQCREIGIGIIVVDQHPHLLSPAATGNIFASICLNLKDPRDINRAAALSQVPDDERHYFSELPVGQGICKLQDRWRQPFLVQFPHISISKGAVTDGSVQAIVRSKRGEQADSGRIWQASERVEGIRRVQVFDDDVEPGEWRLMEDIVEYPDDGVRQRYLRLGLSAGQGQRLKERLVARGWLDTATVPVGNSRKVLLRPSKGAAELLGLGDGKARPESLVHEYWKRWYAKRLESEGYRIKIEAPRVGGRVDVLALKDGKQTSIEIETGRSNVVMNVRNCLRSRYDRIVVVGTDDAAMSLIEKRLGAAGLLIPDRVTVLAAGLFSVFRSGERD